MRKLTLLTVLVGMMVALTSAAAVAKDFRGTQGADTIKGTAKSDTIKAFGGNDAVFGREGNDTLQGGDGADELRGQAGRDTIKGGTGKDKMYGNTGRDRFVAGAGGDTIFARGDVPDRIFCGPGFDVAHVSLNDLVGGTSVEDILSSVTTAEQDALSCEVLVVDGLRVPLGAILDLPQPLEADVSRLLEEFLRDGELSPGEIRDLREAFDLIDRGLLEELAALLDVLLA